MSQNGTKVGKGGKVVVMHKVKDENVSVKAKGNPLKSAVSKKKRRFVAGGYDLDLTYITDRIIAMGFPASKMEAMYRNSIDDVVRFLRDRHTEKYMVYNLCSEKSYDHAKFDNRVVRFPFDDHNCPKFDDLEPFCEALDEWLSDDPSNIAAIHCKAGKGRTGLVICAYLIHTGMWESAAESLRFYGVSRTQNQKGVTIPSQRRWVYDYEKLMKMRRNGQALPSSKWYTLTKIFVSGQCPAFKFATVFNNDSKYECSAKSGIKKSTLNGVSGWDVTPSNALVNKDTKVQFDSGGFKRNRVFSFWFNTDFLENGTFRLDKEEIDKVNKDKKVKDFFIEATFEVVDSKEDEEDKGFMEELALKVRNMSNEQIVVLALKLQDNIVIRSRSWKGRIYKDCFTGTDVVKWLKNEGDLPSPDAACDFGTRLVSEGIVTAVKREGEPELKIMKNGPFFYRFVTEPPEEK